MLPAPLGVAICASLVIFTAASRLPPAGQSTAGPPRIQRDGALYTGIRIDAGRGRIEVVAGTSSEIDIRVTPDGHGGPVTPRVSGSSGSLRISLDDDGRAYRWRVAVPQTYSVRLALDRGSISVHGVEGGVTASVGASSGMRDAIDVDVPRGALDLRVGVGHIRAATRAEAHGPVDVRSGVGNARLLVGGHEILAPRKPGPGHRLRLSGSSGDAMKLGVKVGDASLTIR